MDLSAISRIFLTTLFTILSLNVMISFQGKIDCRKVVFHPSCRGISAKRSNLQMDLHRPVSHHSITEHDTDEFEDVDNLKPSYEFSAYPGLEREETPDDSDISSHRRRHPSVGRHPHPQQPTQHSTTPGVWRNFFSNSASTSTTTTTTTPRPWTRDDSNTQQTIPPRHSQFFLGIAPKRPPLHHLFKPRTVKQIFYTGSLNRVQWLTKHANEQVYSFDKASQHF